MTFSKMASKPNFWFFQITGWVFFGIYSFSQRYDLIFQSSQQFFRWIESLLTLFLLTFILRYLYKPFANRINSFYRFILLSVPVSMVFGFFWSLVGRSIIFLVEKVPFQESYLMDYFKNFPWTIVRNMLNNSWVFMLWSALYFGVKGWQTILHEKENALLSIGLAQKAKLQMLRYQLNPHFLFNSLNSIQGLMYKDLKKADLMLTELSDFLRYTLKFNSDIFITLRSEFEIIEKYLSIEKIRFSDKLEYSINLPANLDNKKILCFLTQPFVENAIKHGLRSNPYGKIDVQVDASVEDNRLVILIQNTGKWIDNGDNLGTGVCNVRERLQNAYPDKYSLGIFREDNKVKVEIKMPCNE